MMHSSIKPGDKVLRTRSIEIIPGRWGYGITERVLVAVKISKVTATQATTEDGERFMRRDGGQISGGARFWPVGWEQDFGMDCDRQPKVATPKEQIDLFLRQRAAIGMAEKAVDQLSGNWKTIIKHQYQKRAPAELEQDLEALVAIYNRLRLGVTEKN